MHCSVGVWFGAQEGVVNVACKRMPLVDKVNVRQAQELENLGDQSHASRRHGRHDADSHCGGGPDLGGEPSGKREGLRTVDAVGLAGRAKGSGNDPGGGGGLDIGAGI
jgi:hypothetical protein